MRRLSNELINEQADSPLAITINQSDGLFLCIENHNNLSVY